MRPVRHRRHDATNHDSIHLPIFVIRESIPRRARWRRRSRDPLSSILPARDSPTTEDCMVCIIETRPICKFSVWTGATYLPVAGVAGRLILPPVSAACDSAALQLRDRCSPCRRRVVGCGRRRSGTPTRDGCGSHREQTSHASCMHHGYACSTWPRISIPIPRRVVGGVCISRTMVIVYSRASTVQTADVCVTCEPWRYFSKCAAIASSAPCVRWLSRKHHKQMAK